MMEFGLMLDDHVHLALNLGVSFIPWKVEMNKSTTLDWVDQDFFAEEYIGLAIGYSFY
jgi:hypothetical protein